MVFGAFFAQACRTAHPEEESGALEAESKPWYAKDGTAGTCDSPAKACQSFDDDKSFVDLCVAKGFSAKTCGCMIRCSGKVTQVAEAPAPSATAAAAAAASTGADPKACPEDSKIYIREAAEARHPGGSMDRCMDSHVCNGNIGWCSSEERQTTVKLRTLAHGACEQDVLNGICKEGYLDSLSCPEVHVAKLSRIWAEFYNKESGVKRCLRNFICSDDKGSCSDGDLAQAKDIKASIDHDGCEYWLRVYCSIGAKTW